MESKTAAFITLGCKINQYETEAIRREVLELGYEEVRASTPADVYVVNTCSVTAQSGAKSRKYIQRAARTNPEARIVVVGCSSDQEKESFSKIPQVALLGGNEEKPMVASFLDGCWNPGEEIPAEMRDIFELTYQVLEIVPGRRSRSRMAAATIAASASFLFCVVFQRAVIRMPSSTRFEDWWTTAISRW